MSEGLVNPNDGSYVTEIAAGLSDSGTGSMPSIQAVVADLDTVLANDRRAASATTGPPPRGAPGVTGADDRDRDHARGTMGPKGNGKAKGKQGKKSGKGRKEECTGGQRGRRSCRSLRVSTTTRCAAMR